MHVRDSVRNLTSCLQLPTIFAIKYTSSLILLLFLAQISLSYSASFLQDLENVRSEYRVGDVVRFQDYYTGEAKKQNVVRKVLLKSHLRHYPGSIAAEYIRKAKYSWDWPVVHKIIARKVKEKLSNSPKGDEVTELMKTLISGEVALVNLRIGDVIHGVGLSKGRASWYTYEPHEYGHVVRKLNDLGVNKVLLVGGWPKTLTGKWIDSNSEYLSNITEVFSSNKLEVDYRFNGNADDDLLLAYCAKYFIPSKFSGYTAIALFSRFRDEPQLLHRAAVVNDGI